LLQVLAVACFAVSYIGLILPIVGLFSILILKSASGSIKETSRLTSTTRSPVLSLVGETILGSSTIRAFGKQE